MRNYKLLIVLCLTLVTISSIMFGCSGRLSFDDYNYTNPPIIDNDWRDLITDSEINMDGKLDEQLWLNKNNFTFKGDSLIELKMTSYLTDKGMYFGVHIADPALYWSDSRDIFENTSLELMIAADDTFALNKNVVQARIGINGNTQQWIGRKSGGDYDFSRVHFPMMARVNLDGKLNSSGNNGYSTEVFIPWSSIGLNAKPKNVLCLPIFNHVGGLTSNDGRTMNKPAGREYNNPSTYLKFNGNGFVALPEGEIMGNGYTAYTNGFDLSSDNSTNKNTITQNGGLDQYVYFKNLNTTKYLISTEVTVNQVKNGDTHPKFGLMAAKNEKNTLNFFVDPFSSLDNNWVLPVDRNTDNTNWQWSSGAKEFSSMNYKNGNYVKLSVVRDGSKFFFFVNDIIASSGNDYHGLNENDNAFAGFFTMNMGATFKNYYATTDETLIKHFLEDAHAVGNNKILDGNLNDWTAFQLANKVKLTDTQGSGKEVEFYSHLGTNGVSIAAKINHGKYIKNSDQWYNATNFEIFLNGNNQLWINPLSSSGVASVMKTEINSANSNAPYTTIVEAFIPYSLIPGFNEASGNYIRSGFAFKTPGDFMTIANRDGGAATDWWWQDKHFPSNASEQYYINTNGIFESLKI